MSIHSLRAGPDQNLVPSHSLDPAMSQHGQLFCIGGGAAEELLSAVFLTGSITGALKVADDRCKASLLSLLREVFPAEVSCLSRQTLG